MTSIQIAKNVSLRQYSTMRLGGTAAFATAVDSRQQLVEALAWAKQRQLPTIMVGSGSNIVWRESGFDGLLLVNRIQRFETFEEDELNVYATIGSGNNWDEVVGRCTAAGLSGIEALSLIPGTAGATPVQNVGAYGQEIAQTLTTIEAYDTSTAKFVTLPASECAFGYRTSRFKTTDRGRFFITAITLHLTKSNPQPPFYPALQRYLDDHQITEYSPQIIRDAVITIRNDKLPNPNRVANNGSFFANPVVDEQAYVQIAADYENVPHWPAADGRIKLSAAWLLDQAGFKDCHDQATGMATWHKQSLVLINEHAASSDDLLAFKQKIVTAIQTKFGIMLEQEPELLPHQQP